MSFFTETKFPTCELPLGSLETLMRLALIELFKQNAADGMVLVNDEYIGEFYGFVVREDTVVNQLMVDDEYVHDDYGLTGETLLVTDPAIMAQRERPFDYIKLTSGSVWVLLHL